LKFQAILLWLTVDVGNNTMVLTAKLLGKGIKHRASYCPRAPFPWIVWTGLLRQSLLKCPSWLQEKQAFFREAFLLRNTWTINFSSWVILFCIAEMISRGLD
jgi:hypothetical protein